DRGLYPCVVSKRTPQLASAQDRFARPPTKRLSSNKNASRRGEACVREIPPGLLGRRGRGSVLRVDDLNVEDERGTGRDRAGRAGVAVGERRRDVELQLAADTRLLETFEHAGNDALRIL